MRKHRDWYLGDGVYGDGPEYHWDYYNAFVIQPMLLEALDAVGDEAAEWGALREKVRARFTRYAEIQERLIAPEGSYPAIGRSIAYRCGAFQVLALAALRKMLPAEIAPAQARVALKLGDSPHGMDRRSELPGKNFGRVKTCPLITPSRARGKPCPYAAPDRPLTSGRPRGFRLIA